MSLMISVSGIRGIFGTDLHPENLTRFAAAYGSWTGGGKVVIGRDSRVTGALCESVVSAALQSVGCDVIKLGVVPTPTVAMGVLRHHADGGIVISASHNPAEWNALKLLNEKSEFLDDAQGREVIKRAEEGSFNYKTYEYTGSEFMDETLSRHHIEAILDQHYIKPEEIRSRKFKVAVDAVNGAGSYIIPELLYELGAAEVVELNCTPDGRFPHNPEPLPEHLEDICHLVKQEQCDLGVVVDPDADRLALVDENGRLFGEEYTIAAASDFMLARKKGPTVVNLSSSRVNEDVAGRHGVTCYRSAVGEINVVKEMQQREAVIGGEGNGGVINPDLHYGRDALAGIAMILQHLADLNTSASAYRDTLPHYEMSKNKIELKGLDPDEVITRLKDHYSGEQLSTVDGLKIDFEEGWVHLRKSNTEPIMRVYSEAADTDRANELARSVMKLISA